MFIPLPSKRSAGNAALGIIIISRAEDKTEILWIGAYAERQDKLCPEKDLKWVTDKLKALGVSISSDLVVSMKY